MFILALLIIIFLGYLPFFVRPKHAKNVKMPDLSKVDTNEYIALLEDPHTAGQLRLELIRNAKERIEISYHTFSEGVYSSLFVYELLNAAERGVEIRFINDGIIGGLVTGAKKTAQTLANEKNITIGLYEPLNFYPYSWNNRLHDKYLLVDGMYLITGGRNISDKTFMPEGFNFEKVFDRDIFIIGEEGKGIIKELSDYIELLWSQPYIKIMKGKDRPEYKDKLIALGKENTRLHPELAGKPEVPQFFKPDAIHMITNPMGRGSKEPIIWDVLLNLMKESNGDIILQSPYTILYNEQIKDLRALDKELTLITNSLKGTPNLPAYPHYLRQRHKIEKLGTIYEYAGSGSVHTKSFVIGDDISVIASFNLDPRSLHLDTESAYIIKSKEFNQYLRNIYSMWQTQSIERTDGEVFYPEGYERSFFLIIKGVLFRILSIILWPLMPLV